MTITQYWVTTTDNPFDPFKEWDKWYHFDEFEKRYCTTGLIARFSTCLTEDDPPEYKIQESNLRAAIIIVTEIPLGVEGVSYKMVTNEIEDE